MLQPLQFAKGWKDTPEGFIAITDLEHCPNKDCEDVPGTIHIYVTISIYYAIIF